MLWNASVSFVGLAMAYIHRSICFKKFRQITWLELLNGFELGLWSFLGPTANNIGIALTSADQAGFCVQMTTIIVPLIQGICGIPVSGKIWLGCVLAIIGVGFLIAGNTSSSESAPSVQAALSGDVLCLTAAFFYSLFDVRVNKFGKQCDFYNLAYTKMAAYAGFSLLGALFPLLLDWTTYTSQIEQFWLALTPQAFWLILGVTLWNGIFIQFLTTLILIHGQDIVGASRAQVIYAFTPFVSSILAWFLLDETLGFVGVIGVFIFMAAVFIVIDSPPEEMASV